jgi:hypothetical protein
MLETPFFNQEEGFEEETEEGTEEETEKSEESEGGEEEF